MSIDYNPFAKTFSSSREQIRWPEIEYFFSKIDQQGAIVDVACGNGRFIDAYREYFWKDPDVYMGIDLSEKLLEQARSRHPNFCFSLWDMTDKSVYASISQHFGNSKKNIFCIAWFHHIKNFEDRIQTLENIYTYMQSWEKLYMTNWALESPLNIHAYKNSAIYGSENQFLSRDFSIKIGKYFRFYHSFHLDELNYLAQKTNFHILENRLFDNERNFVSIFQK